MKDQRQIDFVVTWVDGQDPEWIERKKKHTGDDEENCSERYRDWGLFRYWFRGVEKYAPWVRCVFLVTDGQVPDWLDLSHPKLRWIKHGDYIPGEYLPTFNSNAIELNLHRIEELGENFVYFNDDVFVINETSPEDFFRDGEACETPHLGALLPKGKLSRTVFNNTEILNDHFSVRRCIKAEWKKWFAKRTPKEALRLALYGKGPYISAFVNPHIHACHTKSTFLKVWSKEYEKLHATSKNKLRTTEDLSMWCIHDWQFMEGRFAPHRPIGKMFFTSDMEKSGEALDYLKRQKGKIVCLNDGENENAFEKHRQLLLEQFESLFPEKCSFEKDR